MPLSFSRKRRSVRAALGISIMVTFVPILLLIILPGCGTPAKQLHITPGVPEIAKGSPGFTDTLQIQYLGVGGLLFRRGDDVVMTPPFYSNPHPLRFFPFISARADTNQIERHLPPVESASVILVGHAHYDHLMDLPYIANHRATNALVLGSTTAINILSAAIDHKRLQSFTHDVGTFQSGGKTGVWHYFRTNNIRVMALQSEHAPQFWKVMLFGGEEPIPRTTLPTRLTRWKEGQTLAYVVDFLKDNGKTIDYRIVYQDSAVNSPPYGGIPRGLEHDRPPDVLIASVGSSGNVKGYPAGVIEAWKPRHVVAAHWENFFQKFPADVRDLRSLPMTDVNRFMQAITNNFTKVHAHLVLPGTWLNFSSGEQDYR